MQNSNGFNGYGYPHARNPTPATPTPHRPNMTNSNMGLGNGIGAQQGAYVPPAKRHPGYDIIRPESSISQATFASQPPMPSFLQRGPPTPMPNKGRAAYPPTAHLPPGGAYRYGPSNLNQQFARLDMGPALPSQRPNVVNGSIYGLGSGRNFRNGGVRPGFGPSAGVIGSGMRKENTAPKTPMNLSIEGSNAGSHPGSHHSNAVANPKAVHFARLIMNGAYEDPRDVDSGNPGPSRVPPPPSKAVPSGPRRGHAIAAAGQANNNTSPYHDVRTANIRGNSAAYLGTQYLALPQWYKDYQERGITPAVEQVFPDLPLIEACRVARPTTAGVIRIRNVPYSISKSEIIAFLGRNAQVIPQPVGTPFHAIHIMMDRLSGKTLDCFVEVESPREATMIHKHFAKRLEQGRHCKLAHRDVVVEQSTQQELMQELFPRGKNVTWIGNIPKIDNSNLEEFYPGVFSTGFEGFLFEEDLAHMIKHVEMPQRSPFAQRCLVRPYECIIYTIHKYPWYDVNHVLCAERDYLFRVCLVAIDCLMSYLRKNGASQKPDATLPTSITLKELAVAGLTCPGFSELQKARIHRHLHNATYGQYSVPKGMNLRFGGDDVYSMSWPFAVLVKKPGVRDELLEYFAVLLRDATITTQLTLADLHSMSTSGATTLPFGAIDVGVYDKKKTIAEIGRQELKAIEKLLCHRLPRTVAEAQGQPRSLLGSPFS